MDPNHGFDNFARASLTIIAVFFQKSSGVTLVVHGDDFTFTGTDEALDAAEKLMKEWYDIKVRDRLGSSERDAKSITILGRTLRWTESGLGCEEMGNTEKS